ncbi:MAG: hypothetical protein R3C53_16675 [Pirellulaceae bacterium]
MKHSLAVEIQTQPTDSSCGPTCLAAVYRYWKDEVDLHELIAHIGELSSGGTLAVQLACDALSRGYSAEITTHNLQLFDPTWFRSDTQDFSDFLASKLNAQLIAKKDCAGSDVMRLERATAAYLSFLSLGGVVRMLTVDSELIVANLAREIPILCGLSATYLYQESRERVVTDQPGRTSVPDDICGEPVGHFVVLHGYDPPTDMVQIADPMHSNPFGPTNKYTASLNRVVAAILLGIVTYDSNLLAITPHNLQKASET